MALCFLQHETEIRVPDLVHYGGNIQFDDEFSIKFLYLKFCFLVLSAQLYAICFVLYGVEHGFGWWFTYYEYLNFTFLVIYFILSLVLTLRIYQFARNNELMVCLQSSRTFHLTTDTEDEMEPNENPDNFEAALASNPITIHQLNLSVLAKLTTLFQYISLVGLWCGAVLYWMHEFEAGIFNTQHSFGMQFVTITTYLAIQIISALEFFINGFRLRYFGFIWPLLVMMLVIAMNAFQITMGHLDWDGEYDQHLFTELDWTNDVEEAVVTCIWSMAILLICNVSFTFVKNVCLCKWSIHYRHNQLYPDAPEEEDVNLRSV